jgi:hypothetical protein
MTDPRPGEQSGQPPQDRYRHPEAQLGGADAVEKTTYVTGRGAEPEARSPIGVPTAQTPSGSGRNPAMWIVVAVVLLVIVVYASGLFR